MTRTNETDSTRVGEEQLSTADFARRSEPVERKASDRSASTSAHAEGLFPGTEAQDFQGRWSDIQTGFVDEPRRAVQQADALVAEVMQRLANVFSDERSRLEHQLDRGGDTDTEALRQAFRRYRSFFDRLLSM